ncbi:MAG: UDP-2,3-diacylglucosamine diphosphatase, partial [Candidatus Nanoarchaeia archaeon]
MKYRTIFISDVHLGTKISQTEKLLDFFRENECEKLYLVGDIVDMAAIRRHMFYWDETHNTVIQKLLRMARKGVKITYIIGNHDIYLSFLIREVFGLITIKEKDIHKTLKGDACLVMHGHQLDGAIRKIPWLYWLG